MLKRIKKLKKSAKKQNFKIITQLKIMKEKKLKINMKN